MPGNVLVASRDSLLPHALIDRLLHQGHNVVAVGDLEITASRDLTSLHSLYNLDILRHDVRNPMLHIADVNQIYHLACPRKQDYDDDPIQALELTFKSTKNLLDVALRCNAKVVFASMTEGGITRFQHSRGSSWDGRLRKRKHKRSLDPTSPPRKRRHTLTNLRTPMSISYHQEGNRTGETLCSAYRQHFGLDVRVVRIIEVAAEVASGGRGEAPPTPIEPPVETEGRVVSERLESDRNPQVRMLLEAMAATGAETSVRKSIGPLGN